MVEAFLIHSTESGYIGGVDDPKAVKLQDVKSKDVVLIADPLRDQFAIDQVSTISSSIKCNKIGVLLSPVSSLYGVNETTGLVLDLNESGLYLSVVFEGKYLPYCSLKYPYTLDHLYTHFKVAILPKIQSKTNLMALSNEKKFAFFQTLLKESVPNDERDCVFIAHEQEQFEGQISFENEELEITISSKDRTLLFKDLIQNHHFFDIIYYTIQRIPSRIRNTLASHFLLTGPFEIQDLESVIRTGLFKYLCASDKVNENQISSIGFINRLAIDYMDVAREQGLLWFSGGQVTRKYVMQDEKYHLLESEFTSANAILTEYLRPNVVLQIKSPASNRIGHFVPLGLNPEKQTVVGICYQLFSIGEYSCPDPLRKGKKGFFARLKERPFMGKFEKYELDLTQYMDKNTWFKIPYEKIDMQILITKLEISYYTPDYFGIENLFYFNKECEKNNYIEQIAAYKSSDYRNFNFVNTGSHFDFENALKCFVVDKVSYIRDLIFQKKILQLLQLQIKRVYDRIVPVILQRRPLELSNLQLYLQRDFNICKNIDIFSDICRKNSYVKQILSKYKNSKNFSDFSFVPNLDSIQEHTNGVKCLDQFLKDDGLCVWFKEAASKMLTYQYGKK